MNADIIRTGVVNVWEFVTNTRRLASNWSFCLR